jgi:hypothetical protein
MTASALREAIDFGKPFRLRSRNGAVINVPARDHAFLNPTGRLLVVFTDDNGGTRSGCGPRQRRSIMRRRQRILARDPARSLNKGVLATLHEATAATHAVDVDRPNRQAHETRSRFKRALTVEEIKAWKNQGRPWSSSHSV